jgi:CheY-like chemotaxis protein
MPTILVADDSLSVRKVAERMLTEAGLEVALAANGEEAMNLALTTKPDLVIADVIMPDKSGFEVCAYIKAQASLANTPVLLVSGFVDDEVTRQAEACRADGVIKKPFQGASLRERVMALLSTRKEQEARAAAAPVEVVAAEAVIEMPAMEMPALAPEPAMALHAEPPSPSLAPPAPAAQLEEEVRTLRETIQRLEGRVAEQEKGLAHLERQLQAFRENAAQAVAQVQAVDARLAEEEKHSAELRKRLAELEPAAASAKQLLQILAEFARHTLKPGEGGERWPTDEPRDTGEPDV